MLGSTIHSENRRASTRERKNVSHNDGRNDPPTWLPLGDIIDRLSIHILCRHHASNVHDLAAHEAYETHFHDDPRLSAKRKQHYLKLFLDINGDMWKLEAILRMPTTQSLAELGTIALKLREKNTGRNSLKRDVDVEASRSTAILFRLPRVR